LAEDVLRTEGVTKIFGAFKAVDTVSIKLAPSSITLLAGPNGSGKTTLANLISGFYRPEAGRVYFDGKDITGLTMDRVYERGLVRTFQIPAPFAKLSVLENLLVAARGNPGDSPIGFLNWRAWSKCEETNAATALGILEELGLSELQDRAAGTLSAGHLKLLEIARAMMAGAKMMILDEPIAGINPKLAHEVFVHIVDINKKFGITFLIIEHRLDIALSYVRHAYVMNDGKLIYDGSPEGVVKDAEVKRVYVGG
jgi:branched-chain amino acid transport system ATP-binding protein